jgi:hypothetical protein
MLSKNNLLQYAYGQGLIQVVFLALQMGYEMGTVKKNPIELEVAIKWESPLPTDMTELANVAAIMVNMGAMSKRTAATQAGLDWSFEESAMSSEKETAMEDAKAQLEMQAEFAPPPTEGGKPPAKTGQKSPLDNKPKQE